MQSNNIPQWLCKEEQYEVKNDHDSFINKTTISLVKTISKIKRHQGGYGKYAAFSPFRMIYILLFIILTSCSKNPAFLLIMATVVFVRMAFLNGDKIKSVVKIVFAAEIISALVLLPSAILHSPKTMITVCIKVFITVSLVAIFSSTEQWNNITSSLSAFHIPQIFIFTLDITVKYIAVLGDSALEMMNALKIRSIGKNKNKAGSLSGVLGVTLLKSKNLAEEMNDAMECRGFDGTFKALKRQKWRKIDWLYLAFVLIISALFVYLEVII